MKNVYVLLGTIMSWWGKGKETLWKIINYIFNWLNKKLAFYVSKISFSSKIYSSVEEFGWDKGGRSGRHRIEVS
jgi:hypothetical protein